MRNNQEDLFSLIPKNLPPWKEIWQEGYEVGKDIVIGRTKYFKLHNVKSEREFKEKIRKEGLITRHINFGMRSWSRSIDALKRLYEESVKQNFRIDRFALNIERRMGLPLDMREKVIPETGTYMNAEDWEKIGQAIPIQPVCLDHMIGSPASFINTVSALKGGVTSIGSMAEIIYRYPLYSDDIQQMIETIKALGVMAAKKDEGAVVETYLEDGVCGSFFDAASYLGWAKLERYIVEELIGAASCLDHGSTFTDPLLKLAMMYALEMINTNNTPAGFVHGDTNSYTHDIKNMDRNAPLPVCDILFVVLGLMRMPSGAAIHAVPLTEAVRIPTVEDQLTVLNMAQRVEEEAHRFMEMVDWEKIDKLSLNLVNKGDVFFKNVLKGLEEKGIDIRNPLELIIVFKKLGSDKIERMFNVGTKNDLEPRGFVPSIQSCVYKNFSKLRTKISNEMKKENQKKYNIGNYNKKRIVVASTDIHEYAYNLLAASLKDVGFSVIEAGTSVDPENLSFIAKESRADIIVLTTWNGMALTYGKKMIDNLKKYYNSDNLPSIFMGGRLLEDIDGILGKDVTNDLNKIGVKTPLGIKELINECKHSF